MSSFKKRLDKIEEYKLAKEFRLLIVEKTGDNLYQEIGRAHNEFTLEELNSLKEMDLAEYELARLKNSTKGIQKYLYGEE